MNSLNLEISDKEFIIKLDRSNYSISALSVLIKRIKDIGDSKTIIQKESTSDIRSHMNDMYTENYDHLSEK